MTWPRIITAMVTPRGDTGNVDNTRAAALARHLWEHGSGGFVLAGSTGEAYALSLDERRGLFESVRAAVPLTVPIWMGTGTNNTDDTVRLTEAADHWGVDGVLVVTPYYNRPNQEGLIEHFFHIVDATGSSVMVYNVPTRTGVSLLPRSMAEIAHHASQPIAIKEASANLDAIVELRRYLTDAVPVYSGDDSLWLPSMMAGAYGVVSVAAHVVGDEMARALSYLLDGHWTMAMEEHRRLWPIFKALFLDSNPIPVKWLLNQLGLPVGPVCLPLLTPEKTDWSQTLWDAYQTIKIPSVG